jgi:GNAT superfamily N-acetyltransferase
MSDTFTLRPMQPSDGPALRRLMEDDPVSGGMQITTQFQVDPVQAWRTLKPNMSGIVAEAPDSRIVGTATVAFGDAQYNGRVLPWAYLENLKVQHEARGHGVGTALAEWRVQQGRDRFGGEGVISTTTTTDNIASQKTMKKWATEFYTPMVVSVRPSLKHAPSAPAGLTARRAEPRDYAQIAEKSNRFYADYQLYSPLTAESLDETLGAPFGVYVYDVIEDASGVLVAGTMSIIRSAVMVDIVRDIPPVLRFLNTYLLHLVPADGRLSAVETNYLWFENVDAARYLWRYIRYAYREHAASLNCNFDPRSPLKDAFRIRPWHRPKLTLVLAIAGPEPLDTARLVCGTLRG